MAAEFVGAGSCNETTGEALAGVREPVADTGAGAVALDLIARSISLLSSRKSRASSTSFVVSLGGVGGRSGSFSSAEGGPILGPNVKMVPEKHPERY